MHNAEAQSNRLISFLDGSFGIPRSFIIGIRLLDDKRCVNNGRERSLEYSRENWKFLHARENKFRANSFRYIRADLTLFNRAQPTVVN